MGKMSPSSQKYRFRKARAMLSHRYLIAFGCWEHCFWALKALLLGAGSIAFGCWKHCFWALEALLLAVGALLLSLLSRFVPFVSFVPVVFFPLFVKIN